MKNPNELKELVPFQLYEIDSIKEYLEDMALKGWKLKYIKTFYYFEKIEPQKLYYTVDFFSNSSMFETIPTVNAIIYYDKFVKVGWEFLCNTGQLYFFVTDIENIIPIQLDEQIRFITIKKTIFKNYALPFILLLPISIITLLANLFTFESVVTSNIQLLLFIFKFLFIILCSTQIIKYIIWNKKLNVIRKRSETIRFLAKKPLKNVKHRYFIRVAFTIIFLLLFSIIGLVLKDEFIIRMSFGGLFIGVLSSFFIIYLYQQKFSKETNIVIYVLFSIATIVIVSIVSVAILINSPEEEPIPDNVSYFSETFLASTTTYNIVIKDGSEISVKIFKSKYDFIINRYLNSKALIYNLNGSFYDVSLPEWDAQYIFSSENRYLIVYKDCVISLNKHLKLSDEDIEQIKLLKN